MVLGACLLKMDQQKNKMTSTSVSCSLSQEQCSAWFCQPYTSIYNLQTNQNPMTPFRILQNHYLAYLSKTKNTLPRVHKSLSHSKKLKQGEVYMVEILHNLSRKAIISTLCLIFKDQMKHSFFSYHSNWPFSFIPSCSIICVTAA